jgi:DNA processing protein
MSADRWMEDWIRFTLVEGIGNATQRKLLQRFGSPGEGLAASATELSQLLSKAQRAAWLRGADPARVDRALEWLSQPGHHAIALGDEGYPALLLQTPDPPTLLYALGDIGRLANPCLAVVGSRNATPAGLDTARDFSRTLSDAGLTVISGLALGIDTAAHDGGMLGAAGTIAVVGTGLDLVYPARNRELAHRIAAQGAIVSEFPLGTRPTGANFPRRNRIISGISRGVLVVEAAIRSGSLSTARYAVEQGREVLAIPGSIHSPLSRGCHWLIKQGAKLVESAADVLEELGLSASGDQMHQQATGQIAQDPVLDALGFDPCDLEVLAGRLGWSIEDVTTRVLELELAGRLARVPGGRVQRRQ